MDFAAIEDADLSMLQPELAEALQDDNLNYRLTGFWVHCGEREVGARGGSFPLNEARPRTTAVEDSH